MNTIMINGSPKMREGSSAFLLEYLCKKVDIQPKKVLLSGKKRDLRQAIEQLKPQKMTFPNETALIIAAPLYIDAIPSHLLNWMEDVEKEEKKQSTTQKKIYLYMFINCGFFEPEQCQLAMEMYKSWSEACGFQWGGGVCIGGGEMARAAEIGHGPNKSLGEALDKVSSRIARLEKAGVQYVHPNFSRGLYRMLGHIHWWKEGKRHGNTKRDLKREIKLPR